MSEKSVRLLDDERYLRMHARLGRLKMSQLAEIIEQVQEGKVLFDTYNYHEGRFCPLGIAYGCHRWIHPTDESVRDFIKKIVYPEPANMLQYCPGNFYHGPDTERKDDLLWLCRELILDKLNAYEHET